MTDTHIQPGPGFRRLILWVIALFVALVAAGALWMTLAPVSFWSMLTPAPAGAELTVSQAHAQALSGDVVLIDIRRPDEWVKTGVGEGASPIDMRRKDFAEALGALVQGNRDTSIALMCARGVRSAKLSKQLADAGFTNIINVPEGMLGSRAGPGWLASDLPTRPYKAPAQ